MAEIFAALHPPLVSFPFVLFFIIFVSELILLKWPLPGFPKIIWATLGFTVIVSIIAYLSGHEASERVSQTFVVPDEVVGKHFLWAKIFLYSAVVTFLLKSVSMVARFYRALWQSLYLVVLLWTLACVTYAGLLGGELVFDHGAGVRAAPEKIQSK